MWQNLLFVLHMFFQREVIETFSDYNITGQWTLLLRKREPKKPETFEGVMICVRHHVGQDKFIGRIIPSHLYKEAVVLTARMFFWLEYSVLVDMKQWNYSNIALQVMLEKINIQRFLPLSSACGSESEARSSYGGPDIRNETNVNPCIEYSPPASQNAVVTEDISSEIVAKNFESNFNSNIFVDKSNLAKHLPFTSLTRTSQNEETNNFDSAFAKNLNTFEIITNKIADKSNEISEPTPSVAYSSSTMTKAVNMNHVIFPNILSNKKNAFANRQSSEFSSFENTQTVGIENNAYKTGVKKHVLSHKYMFLDDVSSFQNNNKPFSVFENLDDTVTYKSKYEFKTPPFKTYYFKPEPKHGELCTISLQKSQNYKQREKIKLRRKFHTDTNKSSKLKVYKCHTKGGYSFKNSILMYEMKKIEKQKWRLEKWRLNTYTIENDKKSNSAAVPSHSAEKFPSAQYPAANCINTHKKEKIMRDNEACGKPVPQKFYMFEEIPVYSKYIIGNPENSLIGHNYYSYTNSEEYS